MLRTLAIVVLVAATTTASTYASTGGCRMHDIDCDTFESGMLAAGACQQPDGTFVDFWHFVAAPPPAIQVHLQLTIHTKGLNADLTLYDGGSNTIATAAGGRDATVTLALPTNIAGSPDWYVAASIQEPGAIADYSLTLGCAPLPPPLFADNFETGDLSAWSP